jgi:hypothetical protein
MQRLLLLLEMQIRQLRDETEMEFKANTGTGVRVAYDLLLWEAQAFDGV